MTNTPERDDGRDTRNPNRPAQPAVPSITPRSAARSPQLQVSDA
ncbi:MAG: hypothetical protein JWM86_2179, partial [Thermoleophilia bacterium]|nr:hypothetical protein [Thermoleophilia bacterium]